MTIIVQVRVEVDTVRSAQDVVLVRQIELAPDLSSSRQVAFKRMMVEDGNPTASCPSNDARASLKSFVEIPLLLPNAL